MTTAVLEPRTYQFDVEDIEYLRHGDKPLLARVFRPRGEGPFPALVECHGGAWCLSDRTTERLRHEAMATNGIVSIALDFRSGNEEPYPASVRDINYAVRWAKLNARALKTRAELVGLSGQSAAGISPCSSPCGRGIRAMRRSLCRPAPARRMRPWAAS